MRTFANKVTFTLLLTICLTGSRTYAQEKDFLSAQFDFAKKLYADEQYYDAITEFKRLLFFDGQGSYGFNANYLIGSSYKGGAKLSDAIKYFSLAQRYATDDSALFNAKVEVIRCNILRRTNEQAEALLEKLENDSRFNNRSKEISYWRGWNYIFEDKWEKAASEFAKIDVNHPLGKLALQVEKEKYSVSFAKVISYILPGFGQFYTGNYLSGIMSLGWTGLFGYLAADAFSAERVFDGFIMSGLFFRFYRGNTQNAENFAIQKNIEISNKALNYLQNKFEGLKP